MYMCYILYICTCGFTISWYLYSLFNVFLLFRRLFLLFEGFSCMCSYVSYFSYCFSYFWNAGKLKKINLLLWKRRFPNFRRISECTHIVFLYSVYLYSFNIFPGIQCTPWSCAWHGARCHSRTSHLAQYRQLLCSTCSALRKKKRQCDIDGYQLRSILYRLQSIQYRCISILYRPRSILYRHVSI